MPPTDHEIEIKLLVRGTPSGSRRRIEQGYFTTDAPEVRVRIVDDREAWLTMKGPDIGDADGPVERVEETTPVDLERARRMLALARGVVRKDRYVDGRWEVDVYDGALEGLMIAEVELDDPDEALPALPAGLDVVRDVTYEERYRNQRLALLKPVACRQLANEVAGRHGRSGRTRS